MSFLVPGLLVFGVLLIIGVGLSLTLAEVRQNRRNRERRVKLIGAAGSAKLAPGAAELALLEDTGGTQAALGRQMRAVYAFRLPHDWGMTADAPPLILTGAGGAFVAWLALHGGLHLSSWIVAAAMGGAFFLAPRALLKSQQGSADKKFTEVFPDTIDMVIRMLRAGLPITAAVRAVGEEAQPPVNAVFTHLADQMAIGIAFEDALALAGERIDLADFKFFAVAVSLQRATGGNLATTLEILSDLMRKRRAVRMKARATTGEVRMSAYVLGGIPFFIIGGLLVMTPDYLAPLVTDRRGKIIIAVAVAFLLAGFGIIRQMMRSVTNAA